MKNFILLLTLIFLNNNIYAQWFFQNSMLENNIFLGVSFIDANNATAVGFYGMIFRTTNSGINWINQPSGTSNRLNGVSFSGVNIGIAVGYFMEQFSGLQMVD